MEKYFLALYFTIIDDMSHQTSCCTSRNVYEQAFLTPDA